MPNIYCVTGLPRSGKTMFATRWIWRVRRAHPTRPVVVNYDVWLPAAYGGPPTRIDTLDQLASVRGAFIVLDELQNMAGSRAWSRHGGEFVAFFSQLGKMGCDLVWTSQSPASVDRVVRDRTYMTWSVRSWRKFGFFWYDCYWGCQMRDKDKWRSGVYLMHPVIAASYDTAEIIAVME